MAGHPLIDHKFTQPATVRAELRKTAQQQRTRVAEKDGWAAAHGARVLDARLLQPRLQRGNVLHAWTEKSTLRQGPRISTSSGATFATPGRLSLSPPANHSRLVGHAQLRHAPTQVWRSRPPWVGRPSRGSGLGSSCEEGGRRKKIKGGQAGEGWVAQSGTHPERSCGYQAAVQEWPADGRSVRPAVAVFMEAAEGI